MQGSGHAARQARPALGQLPSQKMAPILLRPEGQAPAYLDSLPKGHKSARNHYT